MTFAGRAEYDELSDLFVAHDCLVLPSFSEGMPLSVLEAAAHHRVLVVTDVGDMRRLFGGKAFISSARREGPDLKHASGNRVGRADG